MGEFEALSNLGVHDMAPQQIKALREKTLVSRARLQAPIVVDLIRHCACTITDSHLPARC